MCSIENKPALDQTMASRRVSGRPLFVTMMAQFTGVCMRQSNKIY